MQDEEPRDQKRAFDEVKTDGCGVEEVKQNCEGGRSYGDSSQKSAPVAMVEDVPGFEVGGGVGVGCVEQAVRRVEDPNGEGHGDGRGARKGDVAGARDEPGPQRCDGGRVEREQMPEREWAGRARWEGELCGRGHLFEFRCCLNPVLPDGRRVRGRHFVTRIGLRLVLAMVGD